MYMDPEERASFDKKMEELQASSAKFERLLLRVRAEEALRVAGVHPSALSDATTSLLENTKELRADGEGEDRYLMGTLGADTYYTSESLVAAFLKTRQFYLAGGEQKESAPAPKGRALHEMSPEELLTLDAQGFKAQPAQALFDRSDDELLALDAKSRPSLDPVSASSAHSISQMSSRQLTKYVADRGGLNAMSTSELLFVDTRKRELAKANDA